MATADNSDARSIPAHLAMNHWGTSPLAHQSRRDDSGNGLAAGNTGTIPMPDNILNFYMRGSDDPWVPPGIVPTNSSGRPVAEISGSQRFYPDSYNFQDFRSTGQPSECGTLQGDSGYGGSRPTCSIESASTVHEDDRDRSFDSQIADQFMGSFHLNADTPVTQTGSLKYYCSDCNSGLRTQSELNKHIQRHQKPHRCSYPNCTRSRPGEGFSTTNDLARHRRTVHNEHESWYICHHGDCSKKTTKKWPRADNFRSHLLRIHRQKINSDADLLPYYRSSNPTQHEGKNNGSSSTVAGTVSPANHLRATLTRPSEQAMAQTLQSLGPGSRAGHDSLNAFALQSSLPNNRSGPTAFREDQMQYIQPDILHESNGCVSPVDQPQGQMSQPFVTHIQHGNASNGTSLPTTGEGQSSSADTDTQGSSSMRYEEVEIAATSVDHMEETAPESYSPNSKDVLFAGFPSGLNDQSQMLKVLQSFPKEILETALSAKSSGDSSPRLPHGCSACGKGFKRLCELKKHMKRHEKPYGCTFRSCDKAFGSKNDWKRHESSQHYQLETWDCDERDCKKVCHRQESFRHHLARDHSMTDEKLVEEKLEKCRIGRHCSTRFWCGFCTELIEIEPRGGNWWAKRCDHIDNHLFGKDGLSKKNTREWVHEEDLVDKQGSGLAEHPFSETSSSDSEEVKPLGLKRKDMSGHDDQPPKRAAIEEDVYMWTCVRQVPSEENMLANFEEVRLLRGGKLENERNLLHMRPPEVS